MNNMLVLNGQTESFKLSDWMLRNFSITYLLTINLEMRTSKKLRQNLSLSIINILIHQLLKGPIP